MGVLEDALRMRSKEKVLNCMMGEIALLLAPTGSDIRAAHVWSERNTTCDALSRLEQGKLPKLPSLRDAQRVTRRATPRCLLDAWQQT